MYIQGVDIPKIDTLFMACPTTSPILYAQMLGRGIRGEAFGGTKEVTVVDFVDQHKVQNEVLSEVYNYEKYISDLDKELNPDEDIYYHFEKTTGYKKCPIEFASLNNIPSEPGIMIFISQKGKKILTTNNERNKELIFLTTNIKKKAEYIFKKFTHLSGYLFFKTVDKKLFNSKENVFKNNKVDNLLKENLHAYIKKKLS